MYSANGRASRSACRLWNGSQSTWNTEGVCSSKNCKSSGSRLEICQVDLKIVSRREVDLRFVKST